MHVHRLEDTTVLWLANIEPHALEVRANHPRSLCYRVWSGVGSDAITANATHIRAGNLKISPVLFGDGLAAGHSRSSSNTNLSSDVPRDQCTRQDEWKDGCVGERKVEELGTDRAE